MSQKQATVCMRITSSSCVFAGSSLADSIFTVLCSTGMFVSGFLAFLLDNTVPGQYILQSGYFWIRR